MPHGLLEKLDFYARKIENDVYNAAESKVSLQLELKFLVSSSSVSVGLEKYRENLSFFSLFKFSMRKRVTVLAEVYLLVKNYELVVSLNLVYCGS